MQQELTLDRNIVISSEINSEVASFVIDRILAINDYDDQMGIVSTYIAEPIKIYINSGGGNVSDGFAIIDAMNLSKTPIITYGMGLVASMALGIFISGDYRYVTSNTRLMYHSIAYGISGNIKDHENMVKESQEIELQYNDLFKDTLLIKELMDEVRDKKSDLYFSADEAVAMKIADEKLGKCRVVSFEKESEEE